MQMDARWKALLGGPYQSSLLLVVALAPNTEFVLQYPLLIQEVLCGHVFQMLSTGQGCVTGFVQVGVNLNFDKFAYIYPYLVARSDSESDTNLENPSANLPLHKIITQLTPQELAFFSMIDAQLEKVEYFYLAREKEMVAHSFVLLNQLEDLIDHRDVFVCRFPISSLSY